MTSCLFWCTPIPFWKGVYSSRKHTCIILTSLKPHFYPRSLIWVFAGHSVGSQGSKASSGRQRKLWPACNIVVRPGSNVNTKRAWLLQTVDYFKISWLILWQKLWKYGLIIITLEKPTILMANPFMILLVWNWYKTREDNYARFGFASLLKIELL